jgi:glucose/arabinose dehydrogenase
MLRSGEVVAQQAGQAAASRPAQTSAAQLFTDNCAGCHGTGAAGGGRAPNLFAQQLLAHRTDERLHRAILEGVSGTEMPAFKELLSDNDSWRIVAYLRSQSAALGGRPPYVPDPHNQIVRSQKQSFRIEVVTRGLETPWGLAFLPDGRLLVTERPGRLRIVEKGKLLPEPVKGTPKVWERQDAGMMDVILHPSYRRNGWIYLSYAEAAPGHAVSQAEPAAADASAPSPPSMTVIVRGKLNRQNEWVQTQEIFRAPAHFYTVGNSHYGSRLAFDPEGYLFYTIGDRGVFANAQDLTNPMGKIHRVKDDGSIPADNPFVGREGAVPSIWSYGHRNPQGLSWDPVTGLLWESEHGPSGGDEINIIEKGKNYGWGVATMGVQPGITRREAPGMEPPIVYYTPRIAPSGITFYSGKRYPGWKNSLFVAGLAGQQLRRLEIKGRQVIAQEAVYEQFGRTRTLALGPDGLFYVLLQNPTGAGTGLIISDSSPGMIIRLVPIK